MNHDVKLKHLFARATRLAAELLREQAIPLLILFAISYGLKVTLEDAMQNLPRAQEDQRWIIQLGLGLVDLFEGVALILAFGWGIPKARQISEAHLLKRPFETGYLNSFFAEYLRTLAQILLRALLLLIPGLVRYGRLIFVPYIALFSKAYRDGQVDAVELSIELSRGRLRVILGVAIAVILAQFGLELLPQSESLHSLWFRLACGAFSFVISAWAFAFNFELFADAIERVSGKVKDVAHV